MRAHPNPRRYDRIDAALSFGLFLVAFWLFCMVIENEGRKLAPSPTVVADNVVKPWGVN